MKNCCETESNESKFQKWSRRVFYGIAIILFIGLLINQILQL